LRTGEAFDGEYARVNPPYEAWTKGGGQPDLAKLRAVTGKDADLIRKGRDLGRVYSMWKEMYADWWRGRGSPLRAEPWNQSTGSLKCLAIQMANIFTGNDLPDWRTADDVARDDKVLADYLAREAKRAAKSAGK